MNFGRDLREARERRGISLQEIAVSTKISVSALEALENNDISRLPGGIFTRAFIRSYAVQVGLDPDQTIRDFLTQFPEEVHPFASSIESVESEFESQRQIAAAVVGLIVLSAVALGALVFLNMRRGSVPADPGAVIPSAQVAAESPSQAPTTLPGPPPPASPAPGPAVPGATSSSGTQPPQPAPAGTDQLVIVIQPRGPCWVAVTADGQSRFSRVLDAGQRETVRANSEILMDVGDAGAFAFTLNDLPGRAVGNPGQVVKVRINRENYRSYIASP